MIELESKAFKKLIPTRESNLKEHKVGSVKP